RVEILRGPQGSTIYGSDASGGVLQIFTKKGQAGLAAPRLNVTMSAGEIQSAWVGKTTVQQDHALELVGCGPDMSYRLGASYFGQGAWLPDLQTHNNSLTGGLRTRQG